MDNTEIEELRALAFASIPKAQRQPAAATQAGIAKRKRTPGDNEEGEILSDEEVAAAEHLDGKNVSLPKDVPAKLKEDLVTSNLLSTPVSALTPNSTNALSVHPVPRQGEISTSKVVVTNIENGSSFKRLTTPIKRDTKFIHQRHPVLNSSLMTNTPRPSRSLHSRIPNAPVAATTARKEADAFLASLNIPLTANPSPGDRDNSLVIKFTDDDSDSDREPQDQGGYDSRKCTSNGLLQPTSAGLSTQSTDILKSEIDRVKKKIAAIERIKGKAVNVPASKMSRTVSASEISRQRSGGQNSASITTGGVPIELESLRQQIAAKENELQLRKQRGAKEVPTAIGSSSSVPVVLAEQRSLVSRECEGDNKSEVGQEVSISVELTTGAKSQVNGVPPTIVPCSQVEEIITLDNASEPKSNSVHQVSVPNLTFLSSQINAEPESHECDEIKIALRKNGASNAVSNTTDERTIGTPKRKRGESQRICKSSVPVDGSESVKKKQKRDKSCLQAQSTDVLRDNLNSTDHDGIVLLTREGSNAVVGKRPHGEQQMGQGSRKHIQSCAVQMPTVTQAKEKLDPKKTCTANAETISETEADNKHKKEFRTSEVVSEKNTNIESLDYSKNQQSGTLSSGVIVQGQDDVSQRGLEMVFVGTNPPCSSIPVWTFDSQIPSSNIAVFQEVSDRGLDYSQDMLRQWQDEEDLIDKELEEAQQNRRRCEVRERLARRQYRDAQESLKTANIQCEMLYQKREMLSGRIKAAELKFYSDKSSRVPHSQYDGGALVTVSSPGFSARTSMRLEIPPWSKKDTNAVTIQDQHVGGRSCFPNEACPDNYCISNGANQVLISSDKTMPVASSVTEFGHHHETDVFKKVELNEVREIAEHNSSNNISASPLLKSLSGLPKELSNERNRKGPSMKDFLDPRSSELHMDRDKSEIVDRNIPIVSTLTDGNGHHGYSSASFATELERDTRPSIQTSLVNDRGCTVTLGKTKALEQAQFFRVFPSDSVQNAEVSVRKEEDPFENKKVSGHETVKISEEGSTDGDMSVPSSHVNKTLLPNECGSCLQEKFANKILEHQQQVETMETNSPVEINAEEPGKPNREVLQEMENLSVKDCSASILNQSSGLSQSLMLQPETVDKSVNGSSLDERSDDSQSEGAFEDKQTAAPLLIELHMSLDKELLFESSSKISIPFVPSSCLNVLFSHTSNSDMIGSIIEYWNRQSKSSPQTTDQSVQIVSVKYESPLAAFHSYRGASHSVDLFSKISKRAHNIDPYKILCKFEHRGKCNNDECLWQHKRDYTLSLSLIANQGERNAEITEAGQGTNTTESDSLTTQELQIQEHVCKDVSAMQEASWKWNAHLVKVPVYCIGSHLIKSDCSESPLSSYICKQQLGFGQPFSGVHRQVPIDMPCLFDSSLKMETLGESSLRSRQLPVDDRHRLEEGHLSGSLEDTETLIEAALELIDFNLQVEKTEARKTVLYILSRGLEVNPCSAALWVVYLHLFYRWERNISGDDLFYHAVQNNKGSYELWMMFINSREKLVERVEAYESAIVALGSIEPGLEKKSSILLDLAVQRLNFMCVSGLAQDASCWIENLTTSACEDDTDYCSSTSVLLMSLSKSDLCILWICCAFVIIEAQVPEYVMESLGCKQRLYFTNIWSSIQARRSCCGQVMRLMRIAASQGKGCLELDIIEAKVDTDTQFAKEVFAVNLVQSSAVCEGLECSLTWAEKYFNLYVTSVELILLRVQLEEHLKGKLAALDIFEKALGRWPLHRSGKIQLWNQYLGYAYEAEGRETIKVLLARCATEIHESESFTSVSKDFAGNFTPDFPREKKKTLSEDSLHKEDSEHYINKAFRLLPEVVKRQRVKGNELCGQKFSYKDAVFGYINLAFYKVLEGDIESANDILHSALNMPAATEAIQHCLKEIASLMNLGVMNPTPISHYQKLLQLFDRCFIESQHLVAVYPLSKGFCESIKKRRVRLLIEYLLGPCPIGFSFLNGFLESMYGPTLLPTVPLRELIDFTEKILEVKPGNVRLAVSACRAVQSRLHNCNSLTKSAILFWSLSLLVDSLCQAEPQAPEPMWVEAANLVQLLDVDSLLEDFYHLALSVHPFSTRLWSGLLSASNRTGNLNCTIDSALRRGIKIDLPSTNQ